MGLERLNNAWTYFKWMNSRPDLRDGFWSLLTPKEYDDKGNPSSYNDPDIKTGSLKLNVFVT